MVQEDYGSLGNVIAYLNGTQPLQERLKKSLQIFFIPLPVPPQLKEEVVISWLADILSTNKALQYTDEELISVWETLNEAISSQRLQALCKKNWVCSFSSYFIDTLVTTASCSTIATEIKLNLFSILDSLYNTPELSPHIQKLIDQSLSILISLLKWIDDETPTSKTIGLLIKVFKTTLEIIEVKYSTVNSFLTIYDKLLYPLMLGSYRLRQINYETQETKDFLDQMEIFIHKTVFSQQYLSLYKNILELPLQKESKRELSPEGISFFQFLVRCVDTNPLQIGTLFLREFLICFFQSSEKESVIQYQLIVNIMHILGISVKGCPSIEKNSIAALSISQTLLDDTSEGTHIISILQAIYICKLDLDANISNISLKKWLVKLGERILKQNCLSKNNMECLVLILSISPTAILEIKDFLSSVISSNKFSGPSFVAFDNLLCKILDIQTKMRNIDTLFTSISESFLKILKDQKFPSLPKPVFFYEGHQLLTARFMKKLLSTISSLSAEMVLNLGTAVMNALKSSCKLLRTDGNERNLTTVKLTVWLSARILSEISFLDVISISGLEQRVGKLMNALALEGIKPLVSTCLSMEKRDLFLCNVLFDIIFVWAEVHANLLTTDTGYQMSTQFSQRNMLEAESVTDFSPQAPFITKDIWKQFVIQEKGSDSVSFVILQLAIQKVVLLQVQRVEHKAKNIKSDFPNRTATLASSLDYIFEIASLASGKESTNLIAYHLPSILTLLDKKHLLFVARLFVSGIQDSSEPWLKFGSSSCFKEALSLQSIVFSILCDKISALLTGGKRKFEEVDEDDTGICEEKTKSKYLTQKILKTLSTIFQDKTKAEWQEELSECFIWLESLLKRKKKRCRLARASEKDMLALLQIISYFPLTLLKPKRHKSLFTLLVVIMIEEGGLCGRQNIIVNILLKLNVLACSYSFNHIFKLSKKDPIFFIKWLVKEAESFLGSSSIEGIQLHRILSKHLIPPTQSSDLCKFGEHINLLKTTTEAFYNWNLTGKHIVVYAKYLVSSCKEALNNETYLQAALILSLLLKNTLKMPKCSPNGNIQEAAKVLGEWALEMSQNIDLSKITHVIISTLLTSFTTSLIWNKKLGVGETCPSPKIAVLNQVDSNKPKSPAKTISKNNEKVVKLDIDWKELVNNGMKMSNLCINSDNTLLQQQSLDFLLTVSLNLPEFNSNVELWSLLIKSWKAVAAELDSQEELKPIMVELLKTITMKNYKKLLANLTEELEKDALNPLVLSQWVTIISTEPSNPYFTQLKSSSMEKLISLIALQSHRIDVNENKEIALKVLQIFQAVFSSKNNLSLHWKSMVFGVCLNLQLKETNIHCFLKLFHCVCTLGSTLLESEYKLISSRVPTVLSILSHLALSLIAQSDQKLKLNNLQIKELESCGQHLEMVSKKLKIYDYHFSKLVPFTIATIVEGMQQTVLHLSIKVCVERVIFSLFDISDAYSLRHLLVSLPTSITTLLKHLYNTFEESYRYNPRTT